MKDNHRLAIRVAGLIQSRVGKLATRMRNGTAHRDQHMTAAMRRYLHLREYAELARSRQWLAAYVRISRRAEGVLDDVTVRIREYGFQKIPSEQPVASVADIFRDLAAVEEEFGAWEFDREEQILSAQTESIELEGVELGPFEIRLHLKMLEQSDLLNAFTAVALEPNSAAGNNEVTHPHVKDDSLCCGEGSLPIQAALRTGRIFDFFVLVRSVLQTYNPGSAYVSLDSWTGSHCYECGDLVAEDESHFCDHCEHDYCDNCSSYCHKCQNTCCDGCLEACPECQEKACPGCRKNCTECEETFCNACLEEGLCPACKQEKENDHDETEQPNARPLVPASLVAGS